MEVATRVAAGARRSRGVCLGLVMAKRREAAVIAMVG
jgi:hypothetical protein